MSRALVPIVMRTPDDASRMLAEFERGPSLVVERARAMLSEATTVEDAKGISDQGEALALVLRRRRAGLEVQRSATEIVLHAKRRIGEITRSIPKARGGRGKTSPMWGKFAALEAFGISSAEISRCEALAAVPLERLLEHIRGIAERAERLTLRGTIAAVSSSSGYAGDEWRTPEPVIIPARRLLGGRIDCDPASSARANRLIRARVFYTKRDNGLTKRWRGSVWCNPPYSRGLVSEFVAKFLEEFAARVMSRGLILLNNSTDTEWFHSLAAEFPFLLTRGRLGFAHDAAGGVQDSARQGQALFAAGVTLRDFKREFGSFGTIARGV